MHEGLARDESEGAESEEVTREHMKGVWLRCLCSAVNIVRGVLPH